MSETLKSPTPWEEAAAATGTTSSERLLALLAKRTFLSLWSYANVYTDEGRTRNKGDGKELCDLLVVFGDYVIIFSDKDCHYQTHTDTKLAWSRWYRRAIEKSARQLAGAEKFVRSFPERVFMDKSCEHRLPVPLPDSADTKYFLVAVSRGAHHAARQHFGKHSSGTLMLNTSIEGEEHNEHPFQIGFPLPNRRFVHVFDEVAVDLILAELDTVADFVQYLEQKEKFLTPPGDIISIPGEEELLSRYITASNEKEGPFPKRKNNGTFIAFPEGDWNTYLNSPQRRAKERADEISYKWDELIEFQSQYIRAGKAVSFDVVQLESPSHEKVLRALAAQNRTNRRKLAAAHQFVLSKSTPGEVFARFIITGQDDSIAFVFLSMARPDDMTYAEYRSARTEIMSTYCHAIKEGFPSLCESIGVASEPLNAAEASIDFMYVNLDGISQREIALWRELADELDILRNDTKLMLSSQPEKKFPMPFNFVGVPPVFVDESMMPMNRAERRRRERAEKKAMKRR